jgi:cytochrome oxidase Cu insertion factor (SCO1/SenC/PrrC family)
VAANDHSVAPGERTLKRLRLALWIVVPALAVLAAALLFAFRPADRAGSPPVPVAETPAATWAAGAKRAPDIRLRDEHGAPVTLASFRGRPVILTFIDPLCRDYCPTEAKHLNDVANALPEKEKPAILAVSVNVYGNAATILAQDRDKWRLVPQWHWAVGSPPTLARAWRDYHIQVAVSSKTIAGVPVHRIGHTEAAYVIDRNGFQRALFLWPYAAGGVVETLKGLRAPS